MELSGPLECKLVEIVDQPPLPPSPEALEKDPNAEPIDVDGKRGQTLAWVEESKKYVVETFDGDLVAIAEEHLREYEPPTLAEGGFNLAFPGSEGRSIDFQSDIATALTENKYCVVQMTLKQVDRKAVVRQVQDLDKWVRFMPEFEPVYMGQRPDGKRAQWFTDHSRENIDEEYALMDDARDELGNAPGLETCDDHLKNLAICVCNVSPYLGFNGICRSNAMVHMNCANSEEEMGLLEDARSQAVGAGVIQGHLAFFHRRKVCMFYFVNGSGGTLTLHPANRGDEDITISCQEGQAVIFRHDLMDYTYLPEGKQIALQAWVFREQQAGECSLSQPELMAYGDAIEEIPRGPSYGNNGRSVDCMAFCTRIPGMVSSPEAYWTALCNGYDAVIKIPLTRWDHDFYWQPEPEIAAAIGKSYTQHLGLTDNDTQMFSFDNEFFGITEEHVNMIDPPARCQLEVGYDCLYRAGWTKPLLNGASMAIVSGSASGEFQGHQLNGWRMGINSDMMNCLNMGCSAARLQFCLGMTGRCATIETACSSSLTAIALVHTHMRPDQSGQMKLGGGGKQEKYGMGLGANGHFDPFYMTGLCGAKMLSINGRCFTFDQSGDGFCRGEGQAAMYFKQSEGEDLARLAMLCGSCMNQDGRSASLTAPHGPSQQECIRHSLREANIPPLHIQMQELHGTGTALGDPIEVGALRATMMTFQGDVREHPLVKTSSKSNIGHTELCAGICGIIKCVLMGIYCDACPNNHIRLLNPHIDSNAYPVYFCTESVDQGKNAGYGGVSSFGFGGSNARGDIWARSLAGPRNTDPSTKHAVLNADRIFIWGEVCKQARPRLPPTAVENGLDSLEDYEDAYMVGEQPTDEDELFVVGSFNGWTTPEKMTYVEEFGSYIFAMPLGEACVEQFQICMNKNEYFKVFPATKFAASQDAIVLGPGVAPVGNNWVIDGRPQGLPQGTIFHVSLQWELETRRKIVTWEPSLDEYMTQLASELQPFQHRYCVLGSWTNFKPVEMLPARGEKPGTFETAVRIGIMRHEEFRFQRDSDRLQTIYPARQRESEANAAPMWAWTQAGVKAIAHDATKYGHPQVGSAFTPDHFAIACKGDLRIDTVAVPGSKAWNDQSKIFESLKVGGSVNVDAPAKDGGLDLEGLSRLGLISNSGSESVPACGPDHLGEEKNWMVSGTMGESIKILLRVWEGEITVTTVNSRTGIRTWTNQQAALRRKYYVTATWNNWAFTQMQSEGTDIHWLRVTMPQSQMVAFQIVVDEDKAQAIHPDMALTDQLMSPAMGPDAKGDGLMWGLAVESGMTIEIKLDLSQDDRRKVVTWTYS